MLFPLLSSACFALFTPHWYLSILMLYLSHPVEMALDLCQDLGSTGSNRTIFSLSRELRDMIWIDIITEDVSLLSGQQHPHVYQTLSTQRRCLTMFSLLLVNRQLVELLTERIESNFYKVRIRSVTYGFLRIKFVTDYIKIRVRKKFVRISPARDL